MESIKTEGATDRRLREGQILDPIEGYNLVASAYERWHWRDFWRHNEKPLVIQLLKRASAARLSMDLGCGTGEYCRALEELGSVLGVDPSREMLRLANKNVSRQTRLIQASAHALPLRADMVDIIIAARSLSHEADLAGAFEEIGRVSRSGSIAIVSDIHEDHNYPCTRIPTDLENVHIETFKRSPDDIRRVAVRSKWEVEFEQTFRWSDLIWQPTDARFSRIDRQNRRPIFFVMQLRRS